MSELPRTPPVVASGPSSEADSADSSGRPVARLAISSEAGNERVAMERVAEVARAQGLEGEQVERLKTAVSEAALNAIEHGNKFRADLDVQIEVLVSPEDVIVRIMDHGSGGPDAPPVVPDLDAKLAGEQSPRGWGLFLIRHMVDEMRVGGDERHHVIELVFRRAPAEGPRR
jgi:anti-sigma regulatory factor (Ser/Thr protein kinase)